MNKNLAAFGGGFVRGVSCGVIMVFIAVISINAAKTNFGVVNVKMETPRGPNKVERDAMETKMKPYRNPINLWNLIVDGKEVSDVKSN